MKTFREYITEAKLEPGGEDIGKLFGPKGRFSPKAKDAPIELPKEPTYNARVKSGNLNPPAPKKSKKKPAAKRQAGIFPPVTNNLEHHGVTMRRLMKIKDGGRSLRTVMSEYIPGFMKHSDALTSTLHEYHKSTGRRASEFERGLYAHNIISKHLDQVSFKIAAIHKGLPIKKKFGKAKISHFTQDNSWPGERSLKIHFHPLKTYVSGTSELKELTSHLEKHTGHAWYIHPDSGTQMVGTKNSPLILATSINHPWLRGDDGGGGNQPDSPKPKNPKGKQPTGPKAPTRPRTPALV
jgi:hypothetical protein